jgi:hypothetical protein
MAKDKNKYTVEEVRAEIKQAKHVPSEVNSIAKALGMSTTADAIGAEAPLGSDLSPKQRALKKAMEE